MDDALLTQHSIGVKAEKVVVAFIFGSLPDHPPSFFQYIFFFCAGAETKGVRHTEIHALPPSPNSSTHPGRLSLGALEAIQGCVDWPQGNKGGVSGMFKGKFTMLEKLR